MNFSILKKFGKKEKETKAYEVERAEAIHKVETTSVHSHKCYASAYPIICGGISKVLPGDRTETYNLIGICTVRSIIDNKTGEILSVDFDGETISGADITSGRLSLIESELKRLQHAFSGESYFTLSDLGSLPSALQAIDDDTFKQFFMVGINTVEIRSKLDTEVITSIKVNGKVIAGEDITLDVINEVRRALGRSPKDEKLMSCYLKG